MDGGSVGTRVAEAHADTRALRRLTLLILAGLACTLLIFTFMLLASFQAVSMIDQAARGREANQVTRYIDTLPGGMNEITLDAMATTLGLRGARLTRASSVSPDELSVSIAMGSDRVVAWTPQLFGSSTFEIVAPVRIAGGILFIAMVAIIGWRVVVVGSRLDRRRAAATRLAHTDTLTGLGNRRAFDMGLASRCAIASEGGEGIVLVMIDLDDFKGINDALGHAAGDAVLQIVGRHLRETAAKDDLVVRLGGDEFAVVPMPLASTTISPLSTHASINPSTSAASICGSVPASAWRAARISRALRRGSPRPPTSRSIAPSATGRVTPNSPSRPSGTLPRNVTACRIKRTPIT